MAADSRPRSFWLGRWRHAPAALWAALIWLASSGAWLQAGQDDSGLGLGRAILAALMWLAQALPATLPPDKVVHACVFGILAALIARASQRERRRTLALAWTLAAAWGAVDEWHQSYVPGRTADSWDWLADAVGAAGGGWLGARARKPSSQAALASAAACLVWCCGGPPRR